MQTIRRPLQHGLIFIEDVKGGEPPYPVSDEKVQFSKSCISVACLHEIDGDAELILGRAAEVEQTYDPAFDGAIETPNKELKISAVVGEPLLKTKVSDVNTRIRIWRSHPVWPEQVFVGWG